MNNSKDCVRASSLSHYEINYDVNRHNVVISMKKLEWKVVKVKFDNYRMTPSYVASQFIKSLLLSRIWYATIF